MKITIGDTTYSKLTNLKFDPTADVTGSEVPINEFSVDIITEDEIDTAQFAFLYDDRDILWAKYWIIFADRADKNTVRVRAQSTLKLLERRMLDPVMLNGAPVADIVAQIFAELGAESYVLSDAFDEKTLTGFCPKQSCKTRLQWVCFVLGAYIKSFFSDKIEILPVGDEPKLIPLAKTYWKPSLVYGEYTTRVNVTAYSYEKGTPATTDTWVTDGTDTYIQTQRNHSLRNVDVPEGTLTHETHIEGVTLVNADNVDDILSNISRFYFKRINVELDAINNAEYYPGDRILCYTDEHSMADGYIGTATFSFGQQAKSRLVIKPVETVETAQLLMIYQYDGTMIAQQAYTLPVGYPYEIDNPYLDQNWGITRYVFAPENPTASGTLDAEGSTNTEDYVIALGSYRGTLLILSADEFEYQDGTVIIS